jgi:signal transduction histidine kinase/DNA-binding response OmpR family regulator/ABC-type amino acid transport substrate-binding protein
MKILDKKTALFFAVIGLLIYVLGCKPDETVDTAVQNTAYTNYMDIPDLTEREIQSIKALKARNRPFIYGILPSTEAFYDREGRIRGFSVLLCEWLSRLFEIPFEPKIYEWNELMAGIEARTIDFTGELTVTEARRKNYFMTDVIAVRTVKTIRIAESDPFSKIQAKRSLRCAFLHGTTTFGRISSKIKDPYEVFFVNNYNEVYKMLKDGAIDVFFNEEIDEMAFDRDANITVEEFSPLIYEPVSFATTNPDFEPIVSVIQKALQHKSAHYLTDLYIRGQREYKINKFFFQLTPQEQEYIYLHTGENPIPIGIDYDHYPVSFYNTYEKQWQGIALDLLREIEALSGLSFRQVNKEPVEWPVLLEMLEKGEIALVPELIRSPEREGNFLWADRAYQTDYYALLSKSDFPDIDINEIFYAKIGLVRDTAYTEMFHSWFPNHPAPVEYAGVLDAFAALEKEEIDLVMANQVGLLNLKHYLEREEYKVNLMFSQLFSSTYGIHRSQTELCSIVDKALCAIDTNTIAERWMLKNYNYGEKKIRFRVVWLLCTVVLLFMVLISLFVLFQRNRQAGLVLEQVVHDRTIELVRQDRLLHVVNDLAAILLSSDTNELKSVLDRGVEMIARCVNADRVCVWKNIRKDDGRLYYSQVYQWLRVSRPEIDPLEEYVYEEDWEDQLSKGKFVNGPVKKISGRGRFQLEGLKVKSILLVPLFLKDSFWGFASFDDCHQERSFREEEVTILRSGSMMINNAIQRNEMDQNITNALESAKEASRAKSYFLANMSHEIRTPMNAIIGMTSIARSSTDLNRKDYCLSKIEDASNHLLGVINDILDMSKIEANKFELSSAEFEFEKMLQRAVNVINFRVDEKHQRFSVHVDNKIPVMLIGDDQRIVQVITNLLSNAVKFTPENGSISLNAIFVNEENNMCTIQIEVKDSGIGISKEQQARIFKSFQQAESSTSRKFGGTGLGLAISKRIVEMMNGKIWIESELDKGSTFAFTIEAAKGKEAKYNMLGSGVNWSNVRILITDDDPDVREYFVEIIQSFGASCDAAADTKETMDAIKEKGAYNIYFVDWKMPGVDGIELTRRIKEQDSGKSAVVMISSADWNSIENEAKKAGVDKFLSKPLFSSTIADIINECFGVEPIVKAEQDQRQGEEIDDFENYHIILAEDVDINREIVMTVLEPTGLHIDCAENGAIALQLFRKEPEKYDLIFMDVQMPEMDGYEATRRIRAFEAGLNKDAPKIPIIALTANVFKEDIEKCLEAGMNDHLGKPLNFDEVFVILRNYLLKNKE